MAKVRTVHRCSDCGAGFPKWAGQCGSCGAWNTLAEERELPTPARSVPFGGTTGEAARPLSLVDSTDWLAQSTGLPEVDRVLGGGLVPGSVTLLGGEPGIGKSTLLLQLLGKLASAGRRALLISGEESPQQVKLRAERLGALSPDLWIAAETSLPAVLAHIQQVKPEVCVIDSIQTMCDPQLESAPGTVTQVRDCSVALTRLAKELGVAVVLVGHVTKEGNLAGPRVLEHIVDTVLTFEGDRHHHLRLLRAVKHRFGATGELGLFEMVGEGLRAVADPSSMLLGDRQSGVPGSLLVPLVEGHRPLLVEVQGLVAAGTQAIPRRVAQGFDINRLAVLIAVMDRRVGIPVGAYDVFMSVVGGIRIVEPAADLAVALAVLSSVTDEALPDDLVAIGEVGLAGEVRQVSHYPKRLAEAARLGIRSAIVPASAPDVSVPGLQILKVPSLAAAAAELGLKRAKNKPAPRGGNTERGGGRPTEIQPIRPFNGYGGRNIKADNSISSDDDWE
jgi:DNA repair protein RadA/Sms